jgi:hypothetical protein
MKHDCTDPLDPIGEFLTPGGAYDIDRMMSEIAKLRKETFADDFDNATRSAADWCERARKAEKALAEVTLERDAAKAEAKVYRDRIDVRCRCCRETADCVIDPVDGGI